MSNEEKADIFLDAVLAGDFSTIKELITEDIQCLGASGISYSRKEMEAYFKHYGEQPSPFKDSKLKKIRTINCGDILVIESYSTGIQVREYMGIPPANKPFEIPTINIFDFENGKIKAWKEYQNTKILLDLSNR